MTDDALASALLDMSLKLREGGAERYTSLAVAANLPLEEVVASPFAIRSIAMAVAVGGATVHHELRVQVPWAEQLQGDAAVATDDHGYWDAGTLLVGKYRAFAQDEAFARFNPNHMAKWGPHELMHRACGFFWRSDATRWEHYLGARLNELLPVVVWYGLDEVARLDRDGFVREREASQRGASLDRALWLTESESDLANRIQVGVKHFREGLAHFEREMVAIDEELRSGTTVAAPHSFLNSSSDATAYVVGHFARVSSPSVSSFIEKVLRSGVDYTTSIRQYRDQIVATLEQLIGDDLHFDAELCDQRRTARTIWDLAHRAAHHGRARLRRLEPALELAGVVYDECWNGDVSRHAAATDALLDGVPASARRVLVATGLADPHARLAEGSTEQLMDGLSSIAPVTAAGTHAEAIVDALVVGASSWARTPFIERASAAVTALGDTAQAELWTFERALAEAVDRDDYVERLGFCDDELPEDLVSGIVHRNSGFRLLEFAGDPVSMHAAVQDGEDEFESAGPSAWLVGAFFEGVSVLPASDGVVTAWRAMLGGESDAAALIAAMDDGEAAPGLPEGGDAWLRELVAAGAVAWNAQVK
ncbi:MAG: hypothetical protein ACJAYU_002163 [Bradymonadia bacterium]|jgi:hypothetical protein